MLRFFHTIRRSIAGLASKQNFLWISIGAVITYISVVNGFDAYWHEIGSENPALFNFFIEAGLVGFIVPIALPAIAFALGVMRKDAKLITTGHALVESGALAWLASSTLKFFTGRAHPALWDVASSDLSRVFQFGFGEGGIFWGWPSSHATVACAVSAVLLTLFPKNSYIKASAWVFALYIVIGVSLTFHWFSDAVAGAILGTIIGLVVGRSFATMVPI